ncbi:non-hydrolyzing UDP-N-acetylglucosamine 2-epimerase, partial [Candidatus Margulisiibacteriota bacterium]
NTVVDALYMIAKGSFDLKKAGLDPAKENGKMILVTTHRRENFGPPLKNICEALKHLATSHPEELSIVLPVHKNPTVSSAINNALSGISNIQLIKPLEYEPFVHLMKRSYLILTDSGGIQEEAPSLGKPVLVLREVTERPEAVECGAVKVVGMDKENIVKETEKLLYDKEEYEKMAEAVNPYGDGKASERIVGVLLNYFGFTDVLPEEFLADKANLKKVA